MMKDDKNGCRRSRSTGRKERNISQMSVAGRAGRGGIEVVLNAKIPVAALVRERAK